MSRLQWVICAVAALGFAFDSYELLMLPLIVQPALADLLHVAPNSPEVNTWVGMLLYYPAVAGGIFGLLGGYLTDRLGRRRILLYSILLYGFSAFAAGFATTAPSLLFWRCCTFVGVCVEFVAAVAWLSELFAEPAQRERVIGYTQAFGSFGGVMVTAAYYLIVTYGQSLPEIHGGHAAWRYTLISGVIPAIPLMIVRPFLPESPEWLNKKREGMLRRPSFAVLFTPQFRRTTIVTTIMMACAYAAAFGALQQMPRVVRGLAQVQHMETKPLEQIVSGVQSAQEFGGLAGRVLIAYLAAVIVSRRRLLRLFQIPGLFVMPIVFLFVPTVGIELARWGTLLLGLLTIAQFSFWGNYLPRVYPTYLRGTGESFAANVGGRMIGTLAALVTTSLVQSMPGATLPIRLAYACALVGTTVYAIGSIAGFFLPEPRSEEMPDFLLSSKPSRTNRS
jgi:predicted MFS family arabinose efflux permease